MESLFPLLAGSVFPLELRPLGHQKLSVWEQEAKISKGFFKVIVSDVILNFTP
jgi:hypothetical protein